MIEKFAKVAGASSLALALGVAALPGVAHAGFLEQLFGIAPQAAPTPAPAPSSGQDEPRYYPDAPVRHRAKRKVLVDAKPKLQKPTDLMHDVTLRPGDAVMMKGGIHVYAGDDGDEEHTKSDFQPLDAIRGLPRQERNALIAMDTTRNDPLRGALHPDTLASGRSAAVASPVVAGHDIVDARGKTVRYVGP